MRVLMLGWEFPPKMTGGLGTACQGLTSAMSRRSTEVLFLLPGAEEAKAPPAPRPALPTTASVPSSAFAAPPPASAAGSPLPSITFHTVPARLASPYARSLHSPEPPAPGRGSHRAIGFLQTSVWAAASAESSWSGQASAGGEDYAGDLLNEVHRYAQACLKRVSGETFDVIHAHDWMTFPAGIAIAKATGRPLIVHVHSTEWDRCGEGGHSQIIAIERRGIAAATRVIAVSRRTRQLLIDRYQADPDRVAVVYNGVDRPAEEVSALPPPGFPVPTSADRPAVAAKANEQGKESKVRAEPIVLFLGRITAQKGPAYFVDAARQVLEKVPEARFIMAGTGDQAGQIVELAARSGVGHRLHFTGFLNREEVAALFRRAAVFVMPSVSEPFGIAPLEAISHDVPVILSRTAGVSEVLRHALKVDFWDTREIANKIVAVLRREPLALMLRSEADREIRELTWDLAAESCQHIYRQAAADRATA